MRWRFPISPTAEQQTILKELNAQQINRRTYAVGATGLLSTDSLAADSTVKFALANSRSFSRTQAFIDWPKIQPENYAGIIPPDYRLVLTVNENQTTGQRKVFLAPIDSTDGLIRPHQANRSATHDFLPIMPPANQSGTSIVLESGNHLNLTSILLADVEQHRLDSNSPDSDELTNALSAIDDMLRVPLSGLILNRQESASANRFVLKLADIKADHFQSVLSEYLQFAYPLKNTYVRPDGIRETEFIANISGFDYQERTSGDILLLNYAQLAGGLTYPIKTVGNDLLVASDMEMLLIGLSSIENKTHQPQSCLIEANETILTDNYSLLVNYLPFLGLFLDQSKVTNMVIQKIGDNLVYFCG
ncbi:MAG: hypothetical protein V1738_06055 [Patescibacteria group bacterium]